MDSILGLNSRQTPSHSMSPPPLPPRTCSSPALEGLSRYECLAAFQTTDRYVFKQSCAAGPVPCHNPPPCPPSEQYNPPCEHTHAP